MKAVSDQLPGHPVQHPLLDRIRRRSCTPELAVDFFTKTLTPFRRERLTAAEALQHPYLRPWVAEMHRRHQYIDRSMEQTSSQGPIAVSYAASQDVPTKGPEVRATQQLKPCKRRPIRQLARCAARRACAPIKLARRAVGGVIRPLACLAGRRPAAVHSDNCHSASARQADLHSYAAVSAQPTASNRKDAPRTAAEHTKSTSPASAFPPKTIPQGTATAKQREAVKLSSPAGSMHASAPMDPPVFHKHSLACSKAKAHYSITASSGLQHDTAQHDTAQQVAGAPCIAPGAASPETGPAVLPAADISQLERSARKVPSMPGQQMTPQSKLPRQLVIDEESSKEDNRVAPTTPVRLLSTLSYPSASILGWAGCVCTAAQLLHCCCLHVTQHNLSCCGGIIPGVCCLASAVVVVRPFAPSQLTT